MTAQNAINNFKFLAQKHVGTLAEHEALGRSINILQELVNTETAKVDAEKDSAGVSEETLPIAE